VGGVGPVFRGIKKNKKSLEKHQMGQHISNRVDRDIEDVCNIVADNPDNMMLIWTNQDMHENLPPILDRRYDIDVAPMMDNVDLRYNGSVIVSALIYTILKTKFNKEYLTSAVKLHFLSCQRFYKVPRIEDTSFPYRLSLISILETLRDTFVESEKEISTVTMSVDPTSASMALAPSTAATAAAAPSPHQFYNLRYFYVPKDADHIKKALFQNNLILCNLAVFSSIYSEADDGEEGIINLPGAEDKSYGMIACLIVGYTPYGWIMRFPFGYHWGDGGYGLVAYDYFERYNRDRWLVLIDNLTSSKTKKRPLPLVPVPVPMAEEAERAERAGGEGGEDLTDVDVYRFRLIV
jgi:hypothetical protein